MKIASIFTTVINRSTNLAYALHGCHQELVYRVEKEPFEANCSQNADQSDMKSSKLEPFSSVCMYTKIFCTYWQCGKWFVLLCAATFKNRFFLHIILEQIAVIVEQSDKLKVVPKTNNYASLVLFDEGDSNARCIDGIISWVFVQFCMDTSIGETWVF